MEKFEYIKIILDEINFKYDDIELMTNETIEFIVIHMCKEVRENAELRHIYSTVKKDLLDKLGINIMTTNKMSVKLFTVAANISNLEVVDVDEEDLRLLVKLLY